MIFVLNVDNVDEVGVTNYSAFSQIGFDRLLDPVLVSDLHVLRTLVINLLKIFIANDLYLL